MELTIIVAIIAFLAVTLLLVGLLLFAKAKLTSSGEVTIDINDGEKVITAESGSTLLSTLANNKVFLPSACGGGGSCGMCKCQVLEGGGDILPTETGFISRKLAKDHWRLGCQVKVKENLRITGSRSRARRQEVGVHRRLQPQHLDLPQGVRREAARRREPQVPQRRLHSDRHPEVRRHQVLGHGRRREVPRRLGQVQDVGSGYDQPRRLRSAPTRWPTTRPRAISSCSTSVSPRRRSTRRRAAS